MPGDEPEYLGPYLRAVESHGAGFPSLLFTSRELQERRFAVLGASVALAGRRVADLGSGHADLLTFLERRRTAPAAYVGVEAVGPFHERARQRVGGRPGVRLLHADFVAEAELFEGLVTRHRVDAMIFSGSLNTLAEDQALAVLDRAWAALAAPGAVLAFNFLSGGGDWERPPTGLPRRDTLGWLAWAHERTPQIVFCQHYLGAHDATLVMLRA